MTNTHLFKKTQPWKTVLFVPANKPKYLASAIKLKPDAVQLDLEDSVTPEHKDSARALVQAACEKLKQHGIGSLVRINNSADLTAKDLASVVSENVDAITIPKLESVAQLNEFDQKITSLESNAGMLEGQTKLMGLIETLTGLRNRDGWQNGPKRLAGLALGSEDLCYQIGCEPNKENLIEPCRQVLYAAREANLTAWGMPFSIGEFGDVSGLTDAMLYAKNMGMDGVWCIHPRQVEIAKRIFTLSEAERANAIAIVDAFEQAKEQGLGAVNVNGTMVDLPVYHRARARLET